MENYRKPAHSGQMEGTQALPVLFEEMDRVWLHMQDGHHKKMKKHVRHV